MAKRTKEGKTSKDRKAQRVLEAQRQEKQQRQMRYGIILFFIALTITVIIVSLVRCGGEEDEEQVSSEPEVDFQDWPLISSTAPKLGTPPLTPILSEIDRSLLLTDPVLMREQVRERALFLIKTHPHEEVRRLYGLSEAGKIKVAAQEREIRGNGFFYFPRKESEVPVLALKTSLLLKISSPRDVYEFWLTFSHENVHFEQRDRDEINLNPNARQKCEQAWTLERPAYKRECEVAAEWGLDGSQAGIGNICASVSSDEAFDQALFLSKLNDQWRMRRSEKRCFSIWAKFAGHPHSEAFE